MSNDTDRFCGGHLDDPYLPDVFPVPQSEQDNDLRVPGDYWLTIVIGWLVLIPVFWIYIQISEKVDQEINDSSSGAADGTSGGNS
ncbi:MAG: hypothetical protein R3F36_13645 [Candidatus Competibacteraceae bacterium]